MNFMIPQFSLLKAAFTFSVLCLGPTIESHQSTIKIGTVGALAPGGKGEAAEATLKDFAKSESDLSAEIMRQNSWQQLAEQLDGKTMQLGIFQGHEFAWAQQKHPSLKPLVVAVNGSRYPSIFIVIAKTDSAKDLAGLVGRSLTIPAGIGSLRLFVDQQAQQTGRKVEDHFSKLISAETSEEALDDIVDGKVAAAVVDRAALDMFKRRKPARFAKIKELVHSKQLLPPVIAYTEGSIDDVTRQRFQKSLLDASKKDRGQALLNAFKLTNFEAPAADFPTITKQTLETFPAPKNGS